MLYKQWLFLKIGGLSVCWSVFECAAYRPLSALYFGVFLYIRVFTLFIPLKWLLAVWPVFDIFLLLS